jgi:tRNA threonylcarbamoyladenosine biosynthesis protein TsaE
VTVLHLPDPDATEAFGIAIAPLLKPGDVIALFGDLGAGKTSLCRGILRGLGFEGEVGSPTFPIVQVYDPPELLMPVWHVDLYRIESAEEIEELGLDDAWDDAALLVEWPERLPRLWPHALRLTITADPAVGRNLTAQVPAAWEQRWPPR